MNTLFWAKASIVTGVIAAILNFYAAIRLGNIILFLPPSPMLSLLFEATRNAMTAKTMSDILKNRYPHI